MVVADEAGWLQTVYECILFGQLPVEIGVLVLVPYAVKPDGIYFSVVGEEFGELVVHERIVALPVALRVGTTRSSACSSPYSVLAPPVDVRVIEVESDALLVAFVGQFLHDVALEGCCIDDVVV